MQSPALIKWSYTWNNYPEGTPLDWIANEDVTWHICGYEVGDSGTPHIQGFVHFVKRTRLTALKKKYPGTIHWEAQRGNDTDCSDYVHKIGKHSDKAHTKVPGTEVFEIGGPGKNVPAEIISMAKKREFNEISEEYPTHFLRHGNFIKQIADLTQAKPTNLDALDNYWVYGDSGVGKSYYCRNHWGADNTYTLSAGQKWWPNYRGEATIHIEDLDESHSGLLASLKQWGDHYPFYIEDKGTGRSIRPTRIVISSNISIEDMKWSRPHKDAINRRYKTILFLESMRE